MVALVAFNLQLMAEPVTLEKAQDQAREFLQSIGAQVDALYLVDAPKKVTSSRDEAVYYYLFNFGADKGFVIISGDDRTQPVLAYSEEGNVTPEDIAHTMQPILNKVREAIQTVAKSGGYVYVMDTSSGSVLYINDSISKDLTAEVKAQIAKMK